MLVVEDNEVVARAVAEGLRDRGIAVDVAADGSAGLDKAALVKSYDVIVLDRDLPVAPRGRRLRTDRGLPRRCPDSDADRGREPGDRVNGLNLGADDYLAKPFHFPELVARVGALTRRAPSTPPVLHRGELALDRPRRRATRNGRLVPLNRKELGVLEVLCRPMAR